MDSVLSAIKAKTVILENAHNAKVRTNAENEYFLEKDYILTSFEPFLLDSFRLTDRFNAELDSETAKTLYELESNGMEIVYNSDGETYFCLQMVSEVSVREYKVEYDKKADSFRYVYSVENSDGEYTEEFLEFLKTENGAYVIQSDDTRCYVEFSDEDKIVYFCCGELKNEKFSVKESIFGTEKLAVDRNWVLSREKTKYANVHTYSEGVLSHEDCSSGPWKTVKINEADFASAFYAHK